jgi:hypothetical protein
MIRWGWTELPVVVRSEVEQLAGVVLDESAAPAGRHSEFSTTLRTSAGDQLAHTDLRDRTAFAVAVLGIWEFLQRDQPLPHRERLTDAARRWARHRLG